MKVDLDKVLGWAMVAFVVVVIALLIDIMIRPDRYKNNSIELKQEIRHD